MPLSKVPEAALCHSFVQQGPVTADRMAGCFELDFVSTIAEVFCVVDFISVKSNRLNSVILSVLSFATAPNWLYPGIIFRYIVLKTILCLKPRFVPALVFAAQLFPITESLFAEFS